MVKWVFERQTRDGGAAGEAVPNAVEGGGWSCDEELLVREAIQNSVDAGRPGAGPVTVSFRRASLIGSEKKKMLSSLQLNSIRARHQAGALQLPNNSAIHGIDDPDNALNLLYIEDRNTVGLGGGLSDRIKGHFFRLLFLIGDGSKADADDGSGGSFGFGKGVYANNSNIRTIFVFSVFEQTAETNGQWARLLGCTYLQSHDYESQTWTGRAWFGVPSDGSDGQSPFPIENEQACKLAERLGFSKRNRDDYGTSVLVVGCDSSEGPISLDRLKHSAETWWWPRITDGGLKVDLFDNKTRLPGLDPARRDDLKPFIKVRNCILGKDRDEQVKVQQFNKTQRLAVGSMGLMALTPEDDSFAAISAAQEQAEDKQGKSPAHRSVALIRRPGMVVTYQSWSMAGPASAIGVFQADAEIDRHLKLSEPVEHDRWDAHSRRLGAINHGSEVVESVLRRCRNTLKDYLRGLQPPPPPPRAGLEWLGKLLGQILMPRERAAPVPPEGERGAISIHTESDPVARPSGDGMVKLSASYSLALKPNYEAKEARVRFAPRVQTLEGDNAARGELLVLSVKIGDRVVAQSERASAELSLEHGQRVRVDVVSEEYSADWAVGLHIEAVVIGAEEQ